MKSYNEIAKEVLRRRDERIALAAKRRAVAVKTGSVIACFCVVAISGFFAVNNDYITKSVVDIPTDDLVFHTVASESGDDPISAYITDESDTTDSDTGVDTTTDPVSSDSQSESVDTSNDPITVTPPETKPEPPQSEPVTIAPPETKPEPPVTTDPPVTTTPGTTEPTSTEPEPPVTEDPPTDTLPPFNDTDPPVTGGTDTSAPPDTDPRPTDTAPEPPETTPPYYDSYPPYGDPIYPGLDWESGGFTDVGSSGGITNSYNMVTKADFFYLLYYRYADTRVEAENIFTDCSENSWYFEPVYWASQSGILAAVPDNSGEYFNPFRKILLQDIACYLYAFAGSPEVTGSLETYEDYFRISSYAISAMTWCVEQGIITDVRNYLNSLSNIYLTELEDIFTAFESVIN